MVTISRGDRGLTPDPVERGEPERGEPERGEPERGEELVLGETPVPRGELFDLGEEDETEPVGLPFADDGARGGPALSVTTRTSHTSTHIRARLANVNIPN